LDDPIKLSAVGMGNIIIFMFAMGPILGLNCALEKLAAQAYGAKRLDLCVIYLQRGRVVMIGFSVVLCAVMISSKRILLGVK
jgi:Na+-driven multidrug efflux pump